MEQDKPIDPNIPYKTALEQLQAIVTELQSADCDIDTMVARTRRATELIKLCRARLTATEEELRRVLDDLRTE